MKARGLPAKILVFQAAFVGASMLIAAGALAKTTGVGDDPAIQSGPCYEALVDKNAANPTTAPNRELGSACEAEHGDVDKAWARVIRLWGSDSADVPDYDSYRRADAPLDGVTPKWLAVVGLLLTYAVLGTPMRSAAQLTGAYPGSAKSAAPQVLVSLALRGLIAAAFIQLFSLPYLSALGGVALIAWIAFKLGRAAPSTSVANGEAPPSALSAHLAETINDAAGAAGGVAALALFVQRDFTLFVVALAFALVASIGPIIVARRALRVNRLGATAASALLAAAIGEALSLAPPFSGLAGARIVAPLALAALTLAVGWRAGALSTTPAES